MQGLKEGEQKSDSIPFTCDYGNQILEDTLDLMDQEPLKKLHLLYDTNKNVAPYSYNTVLNLAKFQRLQMTNLQIKMFMTWLNSKKRNSLFEITKPEIQEYYKDQFEAVRTMRRLYFPDLTFDHNLLLRGRQHEDVFVKRHVSNCAVILWRKQGPKEIHTVVLRTAEGLQRLTNYSAVVFYNTVGKTDKGPIPMDIDPPGHYADLPPDDPYSGDGGPGDFPRPDDDDDTQPMDDDVSMPDVDGDPDDLVADLKRPPGPPPPPMPKEKKSRKVTRLKIGRGVKRPSDPVDGPGRKSRPDLTPPESPRLPEPPEDEEPQIIHQHSKEEESDNSEDDKPRQSEPATDVNPRPCPADPDVPPAGNPPKEVLHLHRNHQTSPVIRQKSNLISEKFRKISTPEEDPEDPQPDPTEPPVFKGTSDHVRMRDYPGVVTGHWQISCQILLYQKTTNCGIYNHRRRIWRQRQNRLPSQLVLWDNHRILEMCLRHRR